MHEYVINLHMHTPYSDGFGTHAEIAREALQAGIDVVIVTDHNVLVRGLEGYYREGERKVLLLTGQEVHDQDRQPQKNHLLVIGASRDVATFADDPQRLIDAARQAGGLTFMAHPRDPAAPAIGEDDLGWVSWDVDRFTGLEIWNALSELKGRIKTKLHGLYYVFRPKQIAVGPYPEVIQRWDGLLNQGKRVVGIGGSDAHALPVRAGILRRTVFPYRFHFSGINTHILTPDPLSGDETQDRELVLASLRQGHAFVGYDLPAPTRGFKFTAQSREQFAWMGDEILLQDGVTFQIHLPLITRCSLIKNGKPMKTWENRQNCTYITSEPGVYRVEVHIDYLGKLRGWIFSNPIYVRSVD
jgi:hypothetical protein